MTRKETAIARVIFNADYREDFSGWLREHWDIYEEFERLALAAIKRGRVRLSAKFLFELIRWQTSMSEHGAYKLNGNYSADAARLFDHLNPQNAGMFEFRVRWATA